MSCYTAGRISRSATGCALLRRQVMACLSSRPSCTAGGTLPLLLSLCFSYSPYFTTLADGLKAQSARKTKHRSLGQRRLLVVELLVEQPIRPLVRAIGGLRVTGGLGGPHPYVEMEPRQRAQNGVEPGHTGGG